MATCVDVSGATYPTTFNGNQITPMEGISLFKTLKGKVDANRVLTYEHSGHPAIRRGDWKLVSRKPAMLENDISDQVEYELYNIKNDRSETTNLAAKYPEKVAELKKLMVSEFKRTFVLPRPAAARQKIKEED